MSALLIQVGHCGALPTLSPTLATQAACLLRIETILKSEPDDTDAKRWITLLEKPARTRDGYGCPAGCSVTSYRF